MRERLTTDGYDECEIRVGEVSSNGQTADAAVILAEDTRRVIRERVPRFD